MTIHFCPMMKTRNSGMAIAPTNEADDETDADDGDA